MTLPRFTHSLQFRLTVAFAAALAFAITGVSIYAARATAREIDRFEQQVNDARASRVERLVADAYERQQDWQPVERMLEQAGNLYDWQIVVADTDGTIVADSHPTLQRARFLYEGARIRVPILIRNQAVGSMVFQQFFSDRPLRLSAAYHDDPRFLTPPNVTAPGAFPRQRPPDEPDVAGAQALQATLSGDQDDGPAASQDAALSPQTPAEPHLTSLASSFQRSLLLAGIGAGAVGVLIVSLGTRQALAPVRSLTSAARTLGRGDFAQRIPTRASDEIGELSQTFNDMAHGLEFAEKQRRAMMADIAHELRTPLSNLRGYLEAVKDGVLKPDEQTIETLHQQSLHISRLVEDLRLVALVEAGALHLQLETEHLDELARSTAAEFALKACERGVSLDVSSEAAVPAVHADSTRLRQVIANLLENALTHTPSGGAVHITVEPGQDQSEVVMTVADTGRGIEPDKLARIFDQFYRADASRSRQTGGAGLGLTIAKRLIEAHSGAISAESEPGKGTRMVVRLPAAS